MRALLLLLLLCLGNAWAAVTTTITNRTYASSYPLLVAIPSSYSSPSLVVTLHGQGETGNGTYDGTLTYNSSTNALAATATHGALQTIKNGVTWFADHNVIVAAPQCTASWSTSTLHTTINALIAEFGVNTSRVCLAGLSIGGYGAWNYAEAHPTVLYSLLPCAAASGGDPSPGTITTMGSLKIYYTHDSDDTVASHAWDYGTDFVAQPYTAGWLYELTGVSALDTHPEFQWRASSPVPKFLASAVVTTTRTANWNGSAWTWTSGTSLPTGTWGTTLYTGGGHGGWDLMYGTGPSDFPSATWAWALGISLAVATGAAPEDN